MRLNPLVYGLLVLGIFLGVIVGFRSAGVWSTSGKVTGDGQAVMPDSSDVNSIKGWMSLEQISATYGVPLDELLRHFDLPGDTAPSTALKDLESETFDVTLLREWLKSRGETDQPAAAPQPTATALPQVVQPAAAASPTPHAAPARTITGKTTFQEILDWGVTPAAIEQVIGGRLPAASMSVKDYVTGQGLEFSTIKTALQAAVDQAK